MILQRKVGEAIIINGDITVRVLSIKGGYVSIGTDAPRDVVVDREEVNERKAREP